jgi:hypothetical protein
MCLIMASGARSVMLPTNTVTAGPELGSGALLLKLALEPELFMFGLKGALMTELGGGPPGGIGGGIS